MYASTSIFDRADLPTIKSIVNTLNILSSGVLPSQITNEKDADSFGLCNFIARYEGCSASTLNKYFKTFPLHSGDNSFPVTTGSGIHPAIEFLLHKKQGTIWSNSKYATIRHLLCKHVANEIIKEFLEN